MRARWILPLVVALAAVAAAVPTAQSRNSKSLQIYVVDVEGGNATLIVSPTGESLLIDAGNPSDGRDARRIVAAASDAGVKQIDHLITTHYHADHLGGLPELLPLLPIRHFIDHGPNIDPMGSGAKFESVYKEMYAKAKHTVARAGRQNPDRRHRRSCRHVQRRNDQDAAAGRRHAESVLRHLHARYE